MPLKQERLKIQKTIKIDHKLIQLQLKRPYWESQCTIHMSRDSKS